MKRTSILVSFDVNDLNASYEAVISSKDFSFTRDFGKGSDLVSSIGGNFSQNISLEGNYGNFQVRVYAISSIGVRSNYVSENITVVPPEFYGTFQFSELANNVGANVNDASNAYTITNSPEDFSSGNSLEISDGIYDKNISLSWSLNPPFGHMLHGQSLKNTLLEDTFFDHFKIKILRSGSEINLSSFDENGAEISALAGSLSVANGSVIERLNNYKEFYLNLSDQVFDALDLGRSFSIEVQAFDSKGNDCSASINFNSSAPVISSLTNNIVGNKSTLTWDYSGIPAGKVNNIRIISMPLSSSLKNSRDFEENFNFFSLVANAKKYKNISGSTYAVGDVVSYNGYVYECISQHSSSVSKRPGNDSVWSKIGPEGVYNVSQQTSSSNSYEQFQDWGYKYYYSLTPSDIIGEGDSVEYRIAGDLAASSSSVSIQNALAYESRGDIIFSWDIQDNNGNDVDLNQYRFSSNPEFPPAILGISGHLFDLDMWRNYSKEVIIKQLNDGQNSVSTNADGELSAAPSVGVYDRYEYNISENKNIYTSQGFPVYEVFEYEKIYNQGQYVIVLDQDGLYYATRETINLDSSGKSIYIKPYYSEFNIEGSYESGDCIVEDDSVYEVKQDFGIDYSQGVFRYDTNYNVGDYVIAANNFVQKFDATRGYEVDEVVTFEGNFYVCITAQLVYAEDINNRNYWTLLSEFDEIECSLYVAVNAVSSGVNYPSQDSVNWQKIQLDNENYFSLVIESYPIQGFSDWSSSSSYQEGDIVVYKNDTWLCVAENSNKKPSSSSVYWSTSNQEGVDLVEGFGYKKGDLAYANGFVYECLKDDPLCAPLRLEVPSEAASSYSEVGWKPFWVQDETYDDVVFGHVAIPEGGKRGVGLSLSILDINEEPISSVRITGVNPAPVISNQDFEIDSISVTERVKFNFKYLLGFQERTTFLELYRKPAQEWIDDDYTFEIRDKKNFVKRIEANVDDAYGENIVEIEDFPPVEVDSNGKKIATSYVYKLLPYDDFGSGQQHFVSSDNGDKIIHVFPKNLSSQEEGAPNGPVVRASQGVANLGGVPFPVDNLSGSTAFETFLLNWETKDNDIDFFELWQEKPDSNEGVLIVQEGESTPEFLSQEKNQEGFRRFAGALYSIGDTVPTEQTEFSVINAEKVFDIPGNTRTVSASVAGEANSSANFWVRAVDKGGNKGPFTGSFLEDSSSNILGLSLELGGFNPQSIDGFESSITEKFPKSIALVPDNPFIAGDRNAWSAHKLFWKGGEYNISEYDSQDFGVETNQAKDGYVYWKTGDNAYSFSEGHPAGDENNSPSSDFEDGDFIVARYKDGNVSTQFVAYNTASIGTANIVDGAITTAKIGSLSADKITAGTIDSQKIEIAGTGVIQSKGFSSNEDDGFSINGDGSFLFQSFSERIDPSTGNVVKEKSRLAFDGGGLFLEGRLQTKSGKNKEIVKGSANTNFIKYYPVIESVPHPYGAGYVMDDETVFYPYWHHKVTKSTIEEGKESAPDIVVYFEIQNSNLKPEDVRFDVFALNGENSVQLIGDSSHNPETGYGGENSAFRFDLNNTSGDDIVINEDTMIVKCTLKGGYVEHHGYWFSYPHEQGFDHMIKFAFTEQLPAYAPGAEGYYFAEDKIADSILIRYRSISGAATSDVIIRRSSDSVPGPQGQQGDTGASVDFWFTRSQSFPSAVSSGPDPGNIWYTDYSTLSSSVDKNFINPKNGDTYEGANNDLIWYAGNSSYVLNLSDLGLYYNDIPQVTNVAVYTSQNYTDIVEPITAQVGGTALNHTITFSTANGTGLNQAGYLKFDIAAQGSLYSIKAISIIDQNDNYNFSSIQKIEGDSVAEIPVYALYGIGDTSEPIFNDSIAQDQLANIRFDFKSTSINDGVDSWYSTSYNSGDYVKYNDKYWIALQNNSNSMPSESNENWSEVGQWGTNMPSLDYSGYQIKAAVLLFAGSSTQGNLSPLNTRPFIINTYAKKDSVSSVEIFFAKSTNAPDTPPGEDPAGGEGSMDPPSDNGVWVNTIPAKNPGNSHPDFFWNKSGSIWQIKGTISDKNREGIANAYTWHWGSPVRIDSLEVVEINMYYVQLMNQGEPNTGNLKIFIDDYKYYKLDEGISDDGIEFSKSIGDGGAFWSYSFDNTTALEKKRIYLSKAVFAKTGEDDHYSIQGSWSEPTLVMSAAKEVKISEVKTATGTPGSNAGAVITEVDDGDNEYTNYELALTIPQGLSGNPGSPGATGPAVTYRGDYFEADGLTVKQREYVGKESNVKNRGDIVRDNWVGDLLNPNPDVQYFICKISHTASQAAFSTPPRNSSYWEAFGDVFESVATQLLLTEESYVTEKLEVGDVAKGGFILSNQFEGMLYNVPEKKRANFLYFDPHASEFLRYDASRGNDLTLDEWNPNIVYQHSMDLSVIQQGQNGYDASFPKQTFADVSSNIVENGSYIFKSVRAGFSGNDHIATFVDPRVDSSALSKSDIYDYWKRVVDRPSDLCIKIKDIPHAGTTSLSNSAFQDDNRNFILDLGLMAMKKNDTTYLRFNSALSKYYGGLPESSYFGGTVSAQYYYSTNDSFNGGEFFAGGPFSCTIEYVDRINNQYISDWTPNVEYLGEQQDANGNVIRQADLVYRFGSIWKSTVQTPTANPSFSFSEWEEINNRDRVKISLNEDDKSMSEDYNPNRQYSINDYVRYNGYFYQSLIDNNIGNTPISGSGKWNFIGYENALEKVLVVKISKYNKVKLDFIDDPYEEFSDKIDANKDYSYFFNRFFERKTPFSYSTYDTGKWYTLSSKNGYPLYTPGGDYLDINGVLFDTYNNTNSDWVQTNEDHIGIPIEAESISAKTFADRIWNGTINNYSDRPNGSYDRFEYGSFNLYLSVWQFDWTHYSQEDQSYQFAISTPDRYKNSGFQLIQDIDQSFFEIGATKNTQYISQYTNSFVDIYGDGLNKLTSSLSFGSIDGKLKIKGSFINNSTINETILFEPNSDGSLRSTSGWTNVDDFSSFIGGGYNNKFLYSNNESSFVNIASAIVGGAGNELLARFSTICGGYKSKCNDSFSFIGAGYKNKMSLVESEAHEVWSSTNAYNKHDIVVYGSGNRVFRSLVSDNQGYAPSSSYEKWVEITEIADHQGANFIGSGINNVIEGGSNQTILNGNNNYIKGRYGVYAPKYDDENSWTSNFILGSEGGSQLNVNNFNGWWTSFFGYLFFHQHTEASGFLNSIMQNSWVFAMLNTGQEWKPQNPGWTSNNTYNKDEIVSSNKRTYRSLTNNNTNNSVTSSAHWEPIFDGNPNVSLSSFNSVRTTWMFLPKQIHLAYLTDPVVGFWVFITGRSYEAGNYSGYWVWIWRGNPRQMPYRIDSEGKKVNIRGEFNIRPEDDIHYFVHGPG